MSQHGHAEQPRYRLYVEYTFDDYDEAVRGDATVAFSGLRWRGLLAWSVLFTLVIFPQLWLTPVRTAAGAAPPALGRALINLLAATLPLLIWFLLFAFILANMYLTVRGRKRHRRPVYQFVKPGAGASVGGRWSWMIIVALVLVMQTLVAAATRNQSPEHVDRGFAREAVVRLLPTVLFLGVGGAILWYGARGRIRRGWRGQSSLHLGHTFQFFGDRVVVDTTQSRTESKWTAYPRVLETPSLLLLYASDVAFHILPKRALPGPAEVERFRSFIVGHIERPTQAFPVVSPAMPAP